MTLDGNQDGVESKLAVVEEMGIESVVSLWEEDTRSVGRSRAENAN